MPKNFTSWLYRPYLDLSPSIKNAALHVHGIDIDYINLSENLNLPRIQSVLMASFRESVINQSGMYKYHLQNPSFLPENLRTERWNVLCNYTEKFNELTNIEKLNTVRLLNKLCLYQHTLSLIPDMNDNKDEITSEINYQKTLARHSLFLDHQIFDYDFNEFKIIADEAPRASLPKINALYQMVIHFIKHDYNVEKAQYWADIHKKEVVNVKNHVDDFTFNKLMSRQHRVYGFIPQMKNNKSGVIEEMALAHHYAENLFNIAKTYKEHRNIYHLGAQEMLHPVLESRIKEALWLKDYALAEQRARELVNMCPNDPRARLHLGETLLEQQKVDEAIIHYKASIILGPPGTEVAWYMLGQCYEAKEDNVQAGFSYMMSLHYDPLAVSCHTAIKKLSKTGSLSSKHGFNLFESWIEEISAISDDLPHENQEQNVQPYQHKQFNEINETIKSH